jgi:dTDP-4-dehydrorhamnose reductase
LLRVFVTGVTGQLGHDVVLELVKRGHEAVGSGGRPQEQVDMRVFVSGVAGQLGHDCVIELEKRGHRSIGSDISPVPSYLPPRTEPLGVETPDPSYVQLDITNEQLVKKTIEELKPDVIIHCAAWTAVDAAEDPANQEKVHKINAEGTAYIAEAAKAVDAKMVYISTDYVFDGQGERPWQPDDKNYAPLNYYGQTKLEGELAVAENLDKFFIVRIAWVFGLNGKNFIKTMINVGKTHDTVRVVDDQIGTPTYTKDLARLLVDMVETDKYGYYHATNEGGYISWADLAEEAYRAAGMDVRVDRVTTAEYGLSVAARPYNSRLDKSKLVKNGFRPLPDWKDAVARYIKEAEL